MKPGVTVHIEVELDERWIDRETAEELTDAEILESVAEDWFSLIEDAIEQDGIRLARATAAEGTTDGA